MWADRMAAANKAETTTSRGSLVIHGYPVVGWWKERSHLGKYNETVRYSLIVSVSTTNTEIDLYTPIATQIPGLIETEISTP